MDKFVRASCTLALLACAPAALADHNVFAAGPAAVMTKADFDVAMSSLQETLDKAADGETRSWANGPKGASGKITPRKSFTRDALACRETHFETRAGGRN